MSAERESRSLYAASVGLYTSFPAKMKDVQTVTLTIEKLAVGGDGLAFLDGQAVFVPNVVPGETVRAALEEPKTAGRRDWVAASAEEILQASPDRVTPGCPLFGVCGGCSLQHMEYSRQVREKTRILADCLERMGGIEAPNIGASASVPYGYRNRMQFHRTASGRVGLMRRLSSEVVETPACPVAARPIREWLQSGAGRGRGREDMKTYLAGKDRFLVFASGRPGDDSPGRLFLEGRDGTARVEVAGRSVEFHVKGFFQSNLHALQALVPAATGGLEGETVADLYCGVGLFGSFLKDHFRKVVCVEHNPFTLEYARRNVGERGAYHSVSLEEWVASPAARSAFDAVVVDPPRAGLAPEVRNWLVSRKIPVVSYVSCDPATLARDLKDLTGRGYRMESVGIHDFFPQTGHVESYVRLRWD